MNTAEIIVREMQGGGGFEMRQLLAVSIGQPRKPAKLHSQSKVLPFHKRRRDVIRVRIPAANFGYDLRDRSWGVALISKLAIIAVQLCQLSEVGVTRKRFFHSLPVENVRICRQLHAVIAKSVIQIQHECLRVSTGTFADKVRRNEFRLGIERDENPLVAKVCRVVFSNLPLLLHQEAPNLVTLNAAAGQLAHLFVHHFLAALASQKQQPHDGVPVESGEPLRRANRAALKQALDCTCRYVGLCQHRVSRQPVVGFAERGLAGSAAPALDSALTKISKLFAGVVLASDAGHGFSPLDFCGKKPHTHFGSGVRLNPRFGLAPTPVQAEAGALIVKGYPLGWNNGYFHRWTVSSEANNDYDFHCFPPFSRAVSHALRDLYLTSKSFIPISNLFVEFVVPKLRLEIRCRHYVRNCSILSRLRFPELAILCESLERAVNHGKGILVPTQVVTNKGKLISYVRSAHENTGSPHDGQNQLLKPDHIGLSILLLVLEHCDCQRFHELFKPSDFHCPMITLPDGGQELFSGGIQRIVVYICHIRRVYATAY
jgi:hypothetical protein